MMMAIPGGYVTKKQVAAANKVVKEVPCMCGAKASSDDKSRRQTKIQPVSADPANAGELLQQQQKQQQPLPKRSLWRKMLGKGPKCVCQKLALLQPEPELIKIPSEYVGCTSVLVAGKRVAFTREMQQKLRKSWDPLDPIDED